MIRTSVGFIWLVAIASSASAQSGTNGMRDSTRDVADIWRKRWH